MPQLDLTIQRYKLLKHFFKKAYGFDFDDFYPVKNVGDITSEDAAREYMKFMQLMYFADTTGSKVVPIYKINSFYDMLFTKKVECQDEMKRISEGKRLDSANANRGIGMFFLVKVINHTMGIYKGMLTDLKFDRLEEYFLPPKTDSIRKMEADVKSHSKEMHNWLKDFNPMDYSDDSDADIHLPTVKIDLEMPPNEFDGLDNPFGDDNEE